MPRRRKKSRQYVVDQLQEEDPESYFKYVSKSPHGVSEDQIGFIKAIEDLSIQKVRGFLNRGMDPNFYYSSSGVLDRVNVEPYLIPLHLAVSVKEKDTSGLACEQIVAVLLFFGANPNCCDKNGNTPLHLACNHGNLPSARLLLEAGADPRAVNDKQETVLMYMCKKLSCKEHTAAIVDLLLERGCPVNWTNDKKETALILLAGEPMPFLPPPERVLVFKSLLRHGANVNAKDANGKSALFYELEKCVHRVRLNLDHPSRAELMQALICAGARFYNMDDVAIYPSSDVDARPLLSLLPAVAPILPRSQLRLLGLLVRRMSFLLHNQPGARREECGDLQRDIEDRMCLVPSLMQLCRLAVRECLMGGAVHGAEDEEEEKQETEKEGCKGRQDTAQGERRNGGGAGEGSAEADEGRTTAPGGEENDRCAVGLEARGRLEEGGDDDGNTGGRQIGKETYADDQQGSGESGRRENDRLTQGTESKGKMKREGRRRRSRRKKGMHEGVAALPLPERMKQYLLSSV